MKSLIAKYIVKPFKAFPYFGRFRFWCLYWAYRLTGWHIRHKEWDFVFEYLPKLGNWQKVLVLDVGCARNLFCHEVVARGYELYGFDIEETCFDYPGTFIRWDIREKNILKVDFITCISVLEHIEEGKDKALESMIFSLKIGGRLILTIPTKEFAQGHPWEGFNCQDLEELLPDNCNVNEYTERAGQLCLAIERTS